MHASGYRLLQIRWVEEKGVKVSQLGNCSLGREIDPENRRSIVRWPTLPNCICSSLSELMFQVWLFWAR